MCVLYCIQRQEWWKDKKGTKRKGERMKRVLFILVMMIIPCVGGALTMCVRDSAMVVSLDPAVGGTGYKQNAAEMVWSTTFSYGTIYGEATCLSATDGTPSENTMGVYTNSRGEMLPRGDTLAQRLDGGYCWCRMTHPASSRWVFGTSDSASNCASGCAYYCGYNARSNAALRSGLFGSVGK